MRRKAVTFWVAGILLAAGCQDPAFKLRQSRRDQRIQRIASDAERLDQWRLSRINWLIETDANCRVQRRLHLESTCEETERIESRRREHWKQFPPSESVVIRRMVEGRPDQIPSTFAYMFY